MKKPMNELIRIVEGAIFASSVPVSAQDISKLFAEDDEEEKPALADIRKAIELLQKGYETRGIRLIEVASGFRFQVADFVAPYIAKSIEDKPARYSRALLETLALIAYRQPITRGEIEDIRGVVVSTNIIKTLDEQEWIRIVGYKDVPGKPALYATTKTFLDHFGLKSLEELPPLAELKAIETVDLADEISQDEEAVAQASESEDESIALSAENVAQASAEDIANAAIAAAMQSVRNDEEAAEDSEENSEENSEEDLEEEMITADESVSDPVTAALNEIQAAMLQEEDEAEIEINIDTEIDAELEEALDEEVLDEEDIEEQTLSSILDEIENDRDQEEVL